MSPKVLRLVALSSALAVLLSLAGLTGCSQKVSGVLIPNQRPTVELTNAPVLSLIHI